MRDTLLKEIAELEAQKASYSEQLAQTDERTAKHDAVKAEIDKVEAKLAIKREELEKLDGAAVTAQAELYSQFDSIQIGEITMTLREMCASEQHYQFLSAWLQSYVGDMAQTNAALDASNKSRIEKLEEDVSELEQYRKRAMEYSDKLADMELRRDAAAEELLNAQEEMKRLTQDNEQLRKQLEAKNQPSQINNNIDLAELAKQLHAKKPAITNKRWRGELNKTHYLAELVTTGETIEIPYLEIGQYRELNEDEVNRFRAEEAERVAQAAAEALANQPLVIPQIGGQDFREEETAIPADSVPGEMAEQKDEVIRRLERLERAVFGDGGKIEVEDVA